MLARTHLATVAIASMLVVGTAVGLGLMGSGADEQHAGDGAAVHVNHAHATPVTSEDHPHAHGVADAASREAAPTRPHPTNFRSDEDGEVPSAAEAHELDHHLRSFSVHGDQGMGQMVDQGFVVGNGTLDDPYVIEDFYVERDLTIEDTTKPLVIRNSIIGGQLTLNYVGADLYVHHNRIHDLRVNENVKRSGETTEGLFEHNVIAFIGQLRHFSGEFAHNTIGPRPGGVVRTFLSDTGPQVIAENLVWNFDGYHGGHVHNNTVVGTVAIKLHGHYHGNCAVCPAHDHADEHDFPTDDRGAEGLEPRSHHSYRTHSLAFEHNRISVEIGPALFVNDRNHEGDDRTANSEPNEYLEDLHDHRSLLWFTHNELDGGPFVFDIVNAEDERHDGQELHANIVVAHNSVTMERPRGLFMGTHDASAFIIHEATALELVLLTNTFSFTESASLLPASHRWIVEPPAETSGLLVHRSANATVRVLDNEGGPVTYGVNVVRSAGDVDVRMEGNRFDAKEDIHRA